MGPTNVTSLDVSELPTLPDVAVRVLNLAGDENATARDLELALQRDPGLAGMVLRLANSAHFGIRGTVSTLSHAVLVLGAQMLRSVMLTACTESLSRNPRSSFKDRILWQHSVATGIAARALSERFAPAVAEEAFVAGLLHDIGKIVLDTSRNAAYHDVVERVYNQREPFIAVERELFGFDHAEIGGQVAGAWMLADTIREAVALHHDPGSAVVDPKLSAIVSLANSLCVKLEIGPEKLPDLDLTSLEAVTRLSLDPGELEALRDEIKGRIETEASAFEV